MNLDDLHSETKGPRAAVHRRGCGRNSKGGSRRSGGDSRESLGRELLLGWGMWLVLSSWWRSVVVVVVVVLMWSWLRAAWFSRLVERVDGQKRGTWVDGVDSESRGRLEAGLEGSGESQMHVLGLHLLSVVQSFQT